jgi:hypothetical protein
MKNDEENMDHLLSELLNLGDTDTDTYTKTVILWNIKFISMPHSSLTFYSSTGLFSPDCSLYQDKLTSFHLQRERSTAEMSAQAGPMEITYLLWCLHMFKSLVCFLQLCFLMFNPPSTSEQSSHQ